MFRLLGLGAVLAWAAMESLFTLERDRAGWLHRTCRRALRVLGVRVTTTGRAPRGAVIAANHLGYLDILVLAAQAPCVFVAKREVRGWPVFGWFARRSSTRFIDREKRADVARVAEDFAPVLAAGANLVLFLEGTSTDGRAVLPFRSSLLEPVARGGWPAVPVAIAYAVPPPHSAEREVCWWGDMTLAPHLFGLAGLPCVGAAVRWGEPVTATSDRKVLAAELHRAVRDLRGEAPAGTLAAVEA
ncbi:MAG: 1-acyl-sn-glycerol-3-phosphate acyltransferase [Opitutaceae bacterium]|nr:1-acyl-sn-glycerol-3-phosphate acyltransferase [Opitutaceae bacterium]